MNAAVWGRAGLLPSIVLGVCAFAADRLHKFYQIEIAGWRGGEHVQVTGFFDYVMVWNTGISYGFLTGLPVAALMAIMAAAMALLVWWWWRADSALTRVGLAICIGGAASHIVDRWVYRAVPDFFHFHLGQWSFYVFNISDSMITIGVCLLLLDMLTGRDGAADRSH